MRKNKYNYYFIVFCLCCSSNLWAQSYDQQYAAWKTQQQAKDAQLMASQPEQHYLGKPSLNAVGEKIRLNSANAAQLQQLSGIGEKKAQAIIEYRQKNGAFKSIDELQNVKGIGPALLQKNKAKLAL